MCHTKFLLQGLGHIMTSSACRLGLPLSQNQLVVAYRLCLALSHSEMQQQHPIDKYTTRLLQLVQIVIR